MNIIQQLIQDSKNQYTQNFGPVSTDAKWVYDDLEDYLSSAIQNIAYINPETLQISDKQTDTPIYIINP